MDLVPEFFGNFICLGGGGFALFVFVFVLISAFASVLGEGVCWALLLSIQTTTSYADFHVTYY